MRCVFLVFQINWISSVENVRRDWPIHTENWGGFRTATKEIAECLYGLRGAPRSKEYETSQDRMPSVRSGMPHAVSGSSGRFSERVDRLQSFYRPRRQCALEVRLWATGKHSGSAHANSRGRRGIEPDLWRNGVRRCRSDTFSIGSKRSRIQFSSSLD